STSSCAAGAGYLEVACWMVAEAVGFMMSRAADGGTMAPELVTRDFLGGCQAPAPGDDPRHDAAARHDSVMVLKHQKKPQ
uniref:Uncharacterized protein n=1 Tax=Aegilops tauschii subsp. strangulata TaxID=200361 RepID=A0A453H186_AEGTS